MSVIAANIYLFKVAIETLEKGVKMFKDKKYKNAINTRKSTL